MRDIPNKELSIDDSKSKLNHFYIGKPNVSLESVRLVIISDTHGQLEYVKNIPDGDVLIHTGDICRENSKSEINDFALNLADFKHPHKLLVPGNHDYTLEGKDDNICSLEDRDAIFNCRDIKLLIDQQEVISGLNIYGTPWQLPYTNMAFHLPEKELEAKFAKIPDNTNILLTHLPPHGILDQTRNKNIHIGCTILRKRIDQLPNLQLSAFGHVHESRGHQLLNDVHFINSSMCVVPDYWKKPKEISQEPFVVDIMI